MVIDSEIFFWIDAIGPEGLREGRDCGSAMGLCLDKGVRGILNHR